MNRGAVLLVVVLCAAGCKTGPFGPYVSPRVSGQVLAADSRAPLPEVKVIRGRIDRSSLNKHPKGGELLIRKSPIQTGADGRFALESERVLSIFRGSGWSQVRLTFEHPGYETLRTNYSTLTATNASAGEPMLEVGPVLLQPVRKEGALSE